MRLSPATPISFKKFLVIRVSTMIRNVCAFVLLGMTAVMSAPTNIDNLPCPTVKPSNTTVEQVLGDWYFQEITVVERIPQVQLCNIVEISDLRISDSGKKSFSFLLFKIQNGTERKYVFNKTLDVSSECPGHWITRENDGYSTIVAESDNRKLICLVTPRKDAKFSTFILSREETPQPSKVKTIREKIKAAGITTEGHLITRNGTLC